MNSIITFLLSCVVEVVNVFFGFFIDLVADTLILDGASTLNTFEQVFPQTDQVMKWSEYCGLLIIIVVFFFQLIKIMSGPITKAERPLSLICRTVGFAIAVKFSKPLCGLIFTIATAPYKAMKTATTYTISEQFADGFSAIGEKAGGQITSGASGVSDFVGSLISPIVTLFLIISLFGAFFKLLLEVVERYLILGVLSVFAPLAIATGCSESTNNIFRSWIRAMASQCLLMIFSVFFLTMLQNGMTKIFVDSFGSLVSDFTSPLSGTLNSANSLCLRVMMMVSWCRLGTAMDRHLQTLGLTTLQAGDGLAIDLRNAGSMAKGLSGKAGGLAGTVAGAVAAMRGNGGNNNSTNNVNNGSGKNSNAVGSGAGGSNANGVGGTTMGGGSSPAIGLNSMCAPAANALKNNSNEISAGKGKSVNNGDATIFPLSGPNGEDMGSLTLSKDAPESGRFASITDPEDGSTMYAQASNPDVQDIIDGSDGFVAGNVDDIANDGTIDDNDTININGDDGSTFVGDEDSEAAAAAMAGSAGAIDDNDTININGDDGSTFVGDEDSEAAAAAMAGSASTIDDNDTINVNGNDGSAFVGDEGLEVAAAAAMVGSYDDADDSSVAFATPQTFDSVPADVNGAPVSGSVSDSIPSSQVYTDSNGNQLCNVNGQAVPVESNGDGTYRPSSCAIVPNNNGSGEFTMGTDGSLSDASIKQTSGNRISSVGNAQPGDTVIGKDPAGKPCAVTLSASDFNSVSAKGSDGKMHDCTGQITSSGVPKPNSVVATGLSGVSSMSVNSNGSATVSTSDGKQYNVPSSQVVTNSSGQVGIKTNGASTVSVTDSSGNRKDFSVSKSAMVSNDKNFCPLNNNGSPSSVKYSNVNSNITTSAQNIKTVGDSKSYADRNYIPKNQQIAVNVTPVNSSNKTSLGCIKRKDLESLKVNKNKKKK